MPFAYKNGGDMKKLSYVVLSLVFAAIISSGCSKSSHKSVTLAGSTAFQPFVEKLAEKFIVLHKDIHINVQGGGSAVGIQSATAGNADIGMADLIELPQEAKELTATVVARDGIAVIVNPLNIVASLSSSQVKDIFIGKISNWKDVGGMDAPIRVISREDGSGTRRSFDSLVLNNEKLSGMALFQNSNGTIREAVASDSNAISYLSIGLVNDKVKAVTFDGVPPVNEMVKNGRYPLARPVYFLTKGEISQEAKLFIEYILSEEAQKILEQEGLISAK